MYEHEKLCAQLLRFDWQTNPHTATAKGIRDWDDELPLADRAASGNQIDTLQGFRKVIDNAISQQWYATNEQLLDLEVARQYTVRTLADLTILRPWEKNPTHAIGILAAALNSLLAPCEDEPARDRALVARLRKGGEFLSTARGHLVANEVPELWVEISLGNLQGMRLMLEKSIPIFARSTTLESAILAAASDLIHELDAHAVFLKALQTHATGSFACGPEYFTVMLKEFYMVEMDANDLLAFGRKKVAEFEQALVAQARYIHPDKTWVELIESSKQEHPTAASLISSYGEEKDQAAEFVRRLGLVSIPEGELCTMTETPLYARPTTPLGSMNTTRPYTPGLHSFFNITPVDTEAPVERQEQHLRDNNFAFIRSIAFHEVIPGHHLQACKHKLQPSYFRRNFSNTVLVEGWGLYTEDLMAESGYLSDPLHNLIRLKNALWRAVRVVVDVGLHTQDMPFSEAVRLLQEKIRQEHHIAVGEARRYTVGPTYPSSYMLGRDQILSLRDECRSRWGDDFSLRRFHDELLSYGSLPVSVIRRDMLKR